MMQHRMRMFTMILFTAMVVCLLLWVTNAVTHNGTPTHQQRQGFSFDYNTEHGVYCGWRHSYEGISCVNVNE